MNPQGNKSQKPSKTRDSQNLSNITKNPLKKAVTKPTKSFLTNPKLTKQPKSSIAPKPKTSENVNSKSDQKNITENTQNILLDMQKNLDSKTSTDKDFIKVFIRFRPLNDLESGLLSDDCGWEIPNYISDTQIGIYSEKEMKINNDQIPTNLIFKYDKVFKNDSTQNEIYENVGKRIVDDVMEGYNGTIFAYGQSGSGKTYTMYGPDIYDNFYKGIIPRIVEDIFNYVEKADDNVDFQFKLSVLEIYKEVLYDLLGNTNSEIKIQENPVTGVFIDGLSEVYLSSLSEFFDYAELSQSNRKVAETKLNHNSSRSHCIMILEVTQYFKKEKLVKKGTLNLVDLAGSEKVSKTGAVGETLEEAKKINLSLSTLGNVIHALTRKAEHIPYRDSKLTRILKESLGGNYKTSLIVTCSPHSYNLDEVISSLWFAKRVKTIKNKVKVNIKYSYEELQKMVYLLNEKLQLCNIKLRKALNGEPIDEEELKKENEDYYNIECSNCSLLRKEKKLLEDKIQNLLDDIHEKDMEIARLREKLGLPKTDYTGKSILKNKQKNNNENNEKNGKNDDNDDSDESDESDEDSEDDSDDNDDNDNNKNNNKGGKNNNKSNKGDKKNNKGGKNNKNNKGDKNNKDDKNDNKDKKNKKHKKHKKKKKNKEGGNVEEGSHDNSLFEEDEGKYEKVNELYKKVKDKLSKIEEENARINIIQNEEDELRKIELKIDTFNKIMQDYIKNTDKNKCFLEMDDFTKVSILMVKNTDYQNGFEDYKKRMDTIFKETFDPNNIKISFNELTNFFTINFFYEYLRFYFSNQIVVQGYRKLIIDNRSLQKMNNYLFDIVHDILSVNFDIANDNVINANALNLLKASLVGDSFVVNNQQSVASQPQNVQTGNDQKNIPQQNNNTKKVTFTIGADLNQRIKKLVSKNNLNIKNSFVSPSYKMNMFIPDKSATNSFAGSMVVSDPKNMQNLLDRNKYNPSVVSFNPEANIALINKIKSQETEKSASKLQMIRNVLINVIKETDSVRKNIKNFREYFNDIINLNLNFFNKKILNNEEDLYVLNAKKVLKQPEEPYKNMEDEIEYIVDTKIAIRHTPSEAGEKNSKLNVIDDKTAKTEQIKNDNKNNLASHPKKKSNLSKKEKSLENEGDKKVSNNIASMQNHLDQSKGDEDNNNINYFDKNKKKGNNKEGKSKK